MADKPNVTEARATDGGPRQAGEAIVRTQAQQQLQAFFDEAKDDTRNYRTVASLRSQVAQE